MEQLRRSLLAAERRTVGISPAGRLRVGVGYPNSYHVAMSSLAYQWVVELAASCGDVGVERFFAGSLADGRTFDGESSLGDLDVLAWSCSFELDEPNILTSLDAAGIPLRWKDRDGRHPLVV
ncbi:MAG: radical SAM protein, partial [Acidobacteria bacterium]|nr:radical SAM protein [Candidatus Sulfomarinibacter sp. MAG AM1]